MTTINFSGINLIKMGLHNQSNLNNIVSYVISKSRILLWWNLSWRFRGSRVCWKFEVIVQIKSPWRVVVVSVYYSFVTVSIFVRSAHLSSRPICFGHVGIRDFLGWPNFTFTHSSDFCERLVYEMMNVQPVAHFLT